MTQSTIAGVRSYYAPLLLRTGTPARAISPTRATFIPGK